MINFDTNERDIKKAMGITQEDILAGLSIVKSMHDNKTNVVWLMQRIWIDEQIADRLKCFLLFHLGTMYEKYHGDMKGGE